MFELNSGEDGEIYGSDRRKSKCKRGNGDNNRKQKRSDGVVRLLDAVLSRWADCWQCCEPGRELDPSVCLRLGKRAKPEEQTMNDVMDVAVICRYAVGKEGFDKPVGRCEYVYAVVLAYE